LSSEIDNLSSASLPAAPAAPRRRRYSEEEVTAGPAAAVSLAGTPALVSGVSYGPIWGALALAAVAFVALYYAVLWELLDRWVSDAGWSHGFVVPLISIFFIRLKWNVLRQLQPKGTYAGLGVLAIGVVGQVFFRATGVTHMSMLSMVVSLYGVVLFVFGWSYLKVLWMPVGYLIFAMPPPNPLYVKITTPMQMFAAEFGTWLFPLFGIDPMRSGTVIHLSAPGKEMLPLNVEQACSGMRMLVAFFALAVALAYSTYRPVWQKITLGICALPIAIICNGLRVTMTGVLAMWVDRNWAAGKAHEYFGLLMLGPALLMQLGVAWVLDRIFVESNEGEARS
jgi:exosortase